MRAVQLRFRKLSLLPLVVSSLVTVFGCTKQPDVGPMRMRDGAVTDMPTADMPGPATCTSSAQCDDGFSCTIDGCSASGLCAYTTIDAMCTTGEICVESMGCVTHASTCNVDADCADGNFCNGAERCEWHTCITPPPETSDDGNACTLDTCDIARDLCVRETAPGCDAGVAPSDGGRAMPFVAPRDYAGAFLLVPAQSSGCGAATFSISSLTFAVTATTLTVTGGSFPMTQTPVPTGASFDVTYLQAGCGTYRLQGMFSDSDHFTAMWTALFSGGCGICPNMSASVIGVRS